MTRVDVDRGLSELEEFRQNAKGHVVGTQRREIEKTLSDEFAHVCVPVVEFVLDEVVDHRLSILVERADERGQVEVAVLYLSNGLVVAFGEYFDAVRKLSLSADVFLNKITIKPFRLSSNLKLYSNLM